MERGDTVRPKRRVIDATNYGPSSRLRIVLTPVGKRHRCRGCGKAPCAEAGELYASGKEYGAPLCLDCVEPV